MTEKTSDIQWHIARDGQQHGPLTDAEIKLFVDGGHLLETDLIWQAAFTDWLPAQDVFPPKAKAEPKQDTKSASGKPAEEKPASTDAAIAKSGKDENKKTSSSTAPTQTTANQQKSTSSSSEQAVLNKIASVTPTPVQATGTTRTPEPITNSVNNTTQRQPQNTNAGQQQPVSPNQPQQATGSSAAGAGPIMSGPEHNPQDPSSYSPDNLYASEPSGAGRRVAIAAGVMAVLAGGGWLAINNSPTVAEFARSAMNATSNAISTKPDADDATSTATQNNDDDTVEVVKAPDTPNGSAPETTGSTSETTTATQETTASQETTAAAVAPTPDAQDTQPPATDPIETAAVTPTPPPAATAEPSIDQHYKTSPLWVVVREQFPDWYGERMREIAQLSADKPKSEVATYAMKSLVTLRRENAASALAASSPKLRGIASAFLSNLQALKAHSTDACFSFISKGETSPTVIALYESGENAEPMEAQATAVFEAIAEGRKSPQKRDRPQKPDYDVLATELGQLGWSQADLQLFANPTALARAAPERVCQMVQDWFTAHIAIKDEAVQERLLFETLRPVIAG